MTTTPVTPLPPAVAVFDVNETLSDLSGRAASFEELGAGPELLAAWFAATLRDGFALTAAGRPADFESIAVPTLAGMLRGVTNVRGGPVEAAKHVVGAMASTSHAGRVSVMSRPTA